MSSRQPPPIPRKSVPANIQRAREQIANERNRARARAMVEKARENRARRQVFTREEEEGVERLFQSRNELDAIALMEARQRARERVVDFQERQRQAGEVARNIAEARKIGERTRGVADVRGKLRQALASEDFSREIAKQSVAGRKVGGVGETTLLANALFGGAGLQAVAEQEFGRREARGTKVREPIPEPEPEPEPVREVSGNLHEVDFRGNPIVEGVKGRPSGKLARPRGGDAHGNIHAKPPPIPRKAGTQAGGGFKLQTPPQPFLEPQPEPEPEFDPRQSRRIGE